MNLPDAAKQLGEAWAKLNDAVTKADLEARALRPRPFGSAARDRRAGWDDAMGRRAG